MRWPEHIKGQTVHSRHGSVGHSFRYGVDYVLIDPESSACPVLFSRNGMNLSSVHDRNHGGRRGNGRGVAWAREVFSERGIKDVEILLLTQPRFFGYIFNPVSFWLAFRGSDLVAAIAEVNNTFGDRHSYFCALPDHGPIKPRDRIEAEKVFHVSPFQDVAGNYSFAFDFNDERIAIRIAYTNGNESLLATLCGPRQPMTNRSLLSALVRRPFGPMRTIALIHWQALRLKLKRVAYRPRPIPPNEEVSQ